MPFIVHFLDAAPSVFLTTPYYPRKYSQGQASGTRQDGPPEACLNPFGRPSFGVGETPKSEKCMRLQGRPP
ncbi:hypothetical protein EMIT0P228_20454 [Pseudomonas brassicacearum]